MNLIILNFSKNVSNYAYMIIYNYIHIIKQTYKLKIYISHKL